MFTKRGRRSAIMAAIVMTGAVFFGHTASADHRRGFYDRHGNWHWYKPQAFTQQAYRDSTEDLLVGAVLGLVATSLATEVLSNQVVPQYQYYAPPPPPRPRRLPCHQPRPRW